MAVGAENTEVRQSVVSVVAVDVVEREREVLAAPPLQAASLASSSFNAKCELSRPSLLICPMSRR